MLQIMHPKRQTRPTHKTRRKRVQIDEIQFKRIFSDICYFKSISKRQTIEYIE